MDITEILKKSIAQEASDLHIFPNSPPVMRIFGDLITSKDLPAFSKEEIRGMLYELLDDKHKEIFEKTLAVDMAFSRPELGNFRLNAIHQLHGISLDFRIVPNKVPTIEEIGLPSVVKSLVANSHGLVLVCGPTGSGKTTTLAAMLEYVNANTANHIITIEDPIEFTFQPKKSIINQMEIGRDTPSFSAALYNALRHDPDIIMLGEMRDLKTINLALTAAETGHLVLGTLHATSAPLAISRIIDIFSTREKPRVRNMLAETLQGIICQTLVKKANNKGRVAALEILLSTPAIRHMIREDKITHIMMTMETNRETGMCSLAQHLKELTAKQIITNATARSIIATQEKFNTA